MGQNGLHWLEEVKEWSDKHEEAYMVPADSNRQLADSQLNTLLPKWPVKYRYVYKEMVFILLGDRLRRSMM